MKSNTGLKTTGIVVTVFLVLMTLVTAGGYLLLGYTENEGAIAPMNFLVQSHLFYVFTYLVAAGMIVYLVFSVLSDAAIDRKKAFTGLAVSTILGILLSIYYSLIIPLPARADGALAGSTGEFLLLALPAFILLAITLAINSWGSRGKFNRPGYVLASAIPALYIPVCSQLLVTYDDPFLMLFPITIASVLFAIYIIHDLIIHQKKQTAPSA